jgi:drug/metabolite transporter (DMT)-like permease
MDLPDRSICFYCTTMAVNTQQVSGSTKDWVLVAIPGLIWGASFLFIAEGLKSVGPNGVTFVRLVLGFLTLACFPGARKSIDSKAWFRIAMVAVFWFSFPLAMFPFAEQRVSSALAGMLNGSVPVFAAIVASIIARKAPAGRVLAGLLTGVAGCVIIAVPTMNEGANSGAGVLMIVAACVSYGFALNLVRPLQMQYGALPVIWRGLGIAALLLSPFGIPDVMKAQWHIAPVASLLALGAFGSGIAFAVMATAAGKVGATRSSGAAFLIPPVALLLGVVVRDEHVAPLSIFGAAVCVAGAWMIRPQAPKPAVVEPPVNYSTECAAVRN